MQLQSIHRASLLSLLGLIGVIVGAELWFAPSYQGRVWLCLTVAPLLFALRGFLHGRRYTYQWMSLLSCLYVAAGIVRGWGSSGNNAWYGWLQTLLAVLLFVTACIYAKRTAPSRLNAAQTPSD
jgi:uncharacterized membrane protein